MTQLFGVFNAGATGSPVTIGSITWEYLASLPAGYSAGQAWTSGGDYYVQLNSAGAGVEGIPTYIPGPGDVNGDHRVDINDLTIVLANYGQTGLAWSQGCIDGDPNGGVDINDLTIVLSNYGNSYAAGALAAVPEPCAVAVLAAALSALLAYRWRRRR